MFYILDNFIISKHNGGDSAKCGCCSWLAMKACQGLYAHVYNNHYSVGHFVLQTHCRV